MKPAKSRPPLVALLAVITCFIAFSGCTAPGGGNGGAGQQAGGQPGDSGTATQPNGGGYVADASGKKVVLVIAPEDFRDEELFDTRAELEAAGAEVKVASIASGPVLGMMGGTATPDMALSDVKAADFDAVVFIGGSGASVYINDTAALALAKDAYNSGKITAAICIAPGILANAGLLNGKRATAWSGERARLEQKGAIWTGEPVTIDGKIITGSGPEAAKQFGQAIAGALG